MSRIDTLQNYLADNPNDPFLLYALAMEYRKGGDLQKMIDLYEQLLAEHPDYPATYYHYGKWLHEQEETERAKALFTTGIEKAKAAKEANQERELRDALLEIEYEDE